MPILKLLFSLKGRTRRRDWWLASLVLTVISEGIELLGYILITGKPALSYFDDAAPLTDETLNPYTLFSWVLLALFTWPFLCVSVKRWHDRNKSGWIGAFVLAATYLVLLSRDDLLFASLNGYLALAGIVVVLNLWQLVECGFLDGTKGPNRYGPSPKGIGAAPDVF